MSWTEIGFTVDTPMFLRGANQAHAELRVPSLRGALRFWFRALAGLAFADNLERVKAAEGRVFGSAGDGASGSSSSVLLRKVGRLAKPKEGATTQPTWLRLPVGDREMNGVGYLLGPALYEYPDALEQPCFIPPGTTGAFAVRFRPGSAPGDRQTVGICFAALSLYGGLGARTRRGFGAIRFGGLEELCPGIEELVDSGDPGRLFDRFAAALGPPAAGRPPATTGFSDLPSFSHWELKASQHDHPTWNAALNAVGREFRFFRAHVDRSRPPHNKAGLDRFHKTVTHEYVDVVYPTPPPKRRHVGADFPLAAFGLPIIFKRDGPMVTLWRGEDELRRASPLWIRPHRQANGQWRVVCHVFRSKLWSSKDELRLKGVRGLAPMRLTLNETMAYDRIDEWLASKW